jgi:hypothetical protein
MASGNPGMMGDAESTPPAGKEGAGGYDEETTTEIPPSMTGGKEFQPGDEIVLEVVSVTQGGGLVVKYATDKGEEKGESWEDGFRKEMSAAKPTEEAS